MFPPVGHRALRSGPEGDGTPCRRLPARLAAGGPFNAPDAATFYGGDHRGYTDYPTLGA